ncbi:hypothetical protein ACJX0J_007037, partial [Zea mays]
LGSLWWHSGGDGGAPGKADGGGGARAGRRRRWGGAASGKVASGAGRPRDGRRRSSGGGARPRRRSGRAAALRRGSELCGHGTLAAAHYLISSGIVECDAIEFVAKSGRLTAKKVVGPEDASNLYSTAQYTRSKFFVELDFPVISVVKCNTAEVFSLPGTLNGASIINELQTVSTFSDLILAAIFLNFFELFTLPESGTLPSAGRFVECLLSGTQQRRLCREPHSVNSCSRDPQWISK